MKTIERSLVVGAILCLGWGVTACGGSSGPSSGSGGTGGSGNEIDTCAIITQKDATTLFGNPASPQEGNTIVDPNFEGECLWNWGTSTDQQLLTFTLWNGKNYYQAPSDSTAYAVGDQGYVEPDPLKGVKVGWLHGTLTASVVFVTIGSNVANATTKVDQVEALAQKADQALP